MLEQVCLAAACAGGQFGDPEANLEAMEREARRAADEGAALLLFPELSLTGFLPNHPVGDHNAWLREALALARRGAERLDGPSVRGLERIAAQTGVYLAAGLLEDAGNLLYNTHVLVGPKGRVGAWRKMHIPMFEMPFYNGGPAPEVVETPFGRVGVNICFDALLPESTRLLAVGNAEIVLFPFAADPPPVTPAGWAAWAGGALRARCQENGVYGIACNLRGRMRAAGVEQEFPGGALLVGPRGEVLTQSGDESLLVGTVSAAELAAARAEPEYLFRFRRPELYGPLAR